MANLDQLNQSLQLTINQINIDNAGKDAALANLKVENAELLTALNQERLISDGLKNRLAEMEAIAQIQLAEQTKDQEDQINRDISEGSNAEVEALRAALLDMEAERDDLRQQLSDANAQILSIEGQHMATEASMHAGFG